MMRTIGVSISRIFVKLVAYILSSMLYTFTIVYQIAAFLLSYGLIFFGLFCLYGFVAELRAYDGFTKEALLYAALSAGSFISRWIMLQLIPVLERLRAIVDAYASMPVRSNNYNSNDSYDGYYGV